MARVRDDASRLLKSARRVGKAVRLTQAEWDLALKALSEIADSSSARSGVAYEVHEKIQRQLGC